MDIVSLFSGCGGLDLGFKKAGFNVVWANEFDKTISKTYTQNHKGTILDTRSISKIPSNEIPDCVGVIGGPPCQSWSAAGKQRGAKDPRGKLFYEFVRVLKDKKPLFFLAENVAGMTSAKHKRALNRIKNAFSKAGYTLEFQTLNASDYNVPQSRKRVFFVGYRKDLKLKFDFPNKIDSIKTVKDAIEDLKETAIAAKKNRGNKDACIIPNHEYWTGSFSYIFMSRNRVLSWDKPSFTIQANGRHVSLHPQAPPMVKVKKDVRKFAHGKKELYRRASIRECARIQTFPDEFIFHYDAIANGYKMVGNAVPVELSYALAQVIFKDLDKLAKPRTSKKAWKQQNMPLEPQVPVHA